MSIITEFINRITEIAEFLSTVMRAKKAIPRTAKIIDTAIDEKWPVVAWIQKAIVVGIPKTPAYHIHRGESKMAAKKYHGKLHWLLKKERMRKQDFLALYEYLARKKKYMRSSRTAAKFTGEPGRKQNVELRIWKYHTKPIAEKELDNEWSSAISLAIFVSNSYLIAALEITADELNEEVDPDEVEDLDLDWQGILCFGNVCYTLDSDFRKLA